MTRDDLLRKVAGLACASLFDVKERLANDIDTHDASQRALIEQQAQEIARLRDSERKLTALEAAGVDNWEGYSDAMQMMEEKEHP